MGVNPVLAATATGMLQSIFNPLPTAAMVAALCVAVVVEIVAIPAVLLPGGTITLLAGALIGTGRPALVVAIPMIIAVVGADQLAYLGGAALVDWWQRRRPGRVEGERRIRRGRAELWLTAAMPSLAGAAHLPYRSFVVRLLIMRVPWLAAALSAGTLAAKSLAQIGHVAGMVGVVASAAVVVGIFIARHRPATARVLVRGVAVLKRKLSSTLL